MTRQRAFTLVELMAVMGIMSLLLTILAPSMLAVKALARSAYCKTNLNALSKSAAAYAEGNRGFLMVYKHEYVTVDGTDYIKGPPQTSKTTVCFEAGAFNERTRLLASTSNFGLVYAAKILYTVTMFYCPERIEEEKHMLSFYPKPWGTALGLDGQWIRCGYMWNPWVKVLAGTSADDNLCTFDDGLVLDKHPSDRLITSDLLWGTRVTGHFLGNIPHWNVAFPDGHVLQLEDELLWRKYRTGIETGWEWRDWNGITRPALVAKGVGG